MIEKGYEEREGQLRISLDPVSAPRLERLMERHSDVSTWPGFNHLANLLAAQGETLSLSEPEFDALESLLVLFSTPSELPTERLDEELDAFVGRVKAKGGIQLDVRQIPDMVYECEVRILLASCMPHWAKSDNPEGDKPDALVVLPFGELGDSATSDWKAVDVQVAVECKNIRSEQRDTAALVRKVVDAMRVAKHQHLKRYPTLSNLVLFVNMPLTVLDLTLEGLYTVIVNVRDQADLEDIAIPEPNVVYTATNQTDMFEHLVAGKFRPIGLNVFKPFCIGTEFWLTREMAVFLSAFWSVHGKGFDIGNWSQVATRISNPDIYMLSRP